MNKSLNGCWFYMIQCREMKYEKKPWTMLFWMIKSQSIIEWKKACMLSFGVINFWKKAKWNEKKSLEFLLFILRWSKCKNNEDGKKESSMFLFPIIEWEWKKALNVVHFTCVETRSNEDEKESWMLLFWMIESKSINEWKKAWMLLFWMIESKSIIEWKKAWMLLFWMIESKSIFEWKKAWMLLFWMIESKSIIEWKEP